jgi:ubiquinone/menaquinone biosynthesis C-methylase UbiE
VSDATVWSQRGRAYASSSTHRDSATLEALLALLRPMAEDRCLDLGTGTGHTAARLADHTREVVALDPSPGMLAAARDLYDDRPNLSFVEAPGHASGLATASFDLIAARHTLHHHPDPVATLREAARLLRPGGRLGIVDEITPSVSVDAWYHGLEIARDPDHVRAYTLDAWAAMILEAGLRWVVGDGRHSESILVDPWIDRLNPTPQAATEVRRRLRDASEHARTAFAIRYDAAGDAVAFTMPVATILAIKEES